MKVDGGIEAKLVLYSYLPTLSPSIFTTSQEVIL
jgi:hypothetical protein